MSNIIISCWIRKGIVYLPTFYRSPEGLGITEAPLSIIPIHDKKNLEVELKKRFEIGNQIIEYSREDYKNLLPALGAKNWSSFEAKASSWFFRYVDSSFSIERHKKVPRRGYAFDPNQCEYLEIGTSFEVACTMFIEKIQRTENT